MNEILQYLKENQGRPIFINDIYQAFSGFDRETLNSEIHNLISQGFIYPYSNAYYLTMKGSRFLESQEPGKYDPYEEARKRQRGITYETRKQYWDKWLDHFLNTLEYFRQNHPELEDLFNILGVKAREDIGRWHDATEFAKDVQAIFNKFNFELPELRYGPLEPSYSVPDILYSIEHAIAESLSRLKKYSPRHTSYIPTVEEYREVYDKVNVFLDNYDASSLRYQLDLREGVFVKKDQIIPKFKRIFTKEEKLPQRLIDVAFNQLRGKVENLVKSLSSDIFFEGEDVEEASTRLYDLMMEKGVDVFNNFSMTATDPDRSQILNNMFSGSKYDGFNFTAAVLTDIIISNCTFINAKFSNAQFKGSTVTHNNFQGADFSNTNFREIEEFKDNNIEGANFENASLSPLIDKNVNIGEPVNLKSLVVTKEEMKERGFRGKESFNHVGVSYDKKVPGYELDAKGESWVRYIYATQDTPFPKELFDRFKLHRSVPGEYSLGWIGGKWNPKTKTLYVTEMQSDLMQRTYELKEDWLKEHNYSSNHDFIAKGWTKLKSKLENYYDGWQYVFFNQAVREAKERGAKYIATPTSAYYKKKYPESPYQYYDKIVTQTVKDSETGEKRVEPKYPYREEGHWRFIPVNKIQVWASMEKLSWEEPKYSILIKNAYVNDYGFIESRGIIDFFDTAGKVKFTYDEENGLDIDYNIEDEEIYWKYNTGKLSNQILELSKDFIEQEKFPRFYGKLSSLKFSNEEPSDAQKDAGNYKKKHVKKDGLDISIENEKGSIRSGTDPDGNEWSIKMKNDYGYIKGTVGKDKDHLDCFLSNDYKEGMPVFIVNQLTDKGVFDEHKVLLGFENKEDAEKAYLDNYEKGWNKYDKELVEMDMEDFKEWMKDKKETKKKAKESNLKLSWEEVSLENYAGWVVKLIYRGQFAGYMLVISDNRSNSRIELKGWKGYKYSENAFEIDEKESINEALQKFRSGDTIITERGDFYDEIIPVVQALNLNTDVLNKLSWKELSESDEEKELMKRLDELRKKKMQNKIDELQNNIDKVKQAVMNMYIEMYLEHDIVPYYEEDIQEAKEWAENIVNNSADETIIEEYLEYKDEFPQFKVETALQKLSLDEVYWKTYMERYIDTFIRTQERLEPGLGSKKELAKDAFKFMMDEIPEEVKRDPQFPQLITDLREKLIQDGIGDIFDNTPSYLDRSREDEGDQLVDPEGDPIEETTSPETFNYEEKEDVNDLLDQLSKAKEEGNEEKVEEIKRKLDRIIGLSSLSFSTKKKSVQEDLQNFKKDPYKDLHFNYNKERGQQINEYEPGGGEGVALNPLDMQQVYDTDFFEPDLDQWDEANETLDWQDRSNLQLWV